MGLGQRRSRKTGRSKNRSLGKYVKTKRRTKDFETGELSEYFVFRTFFKISI